MFIEIVLSKLLWSAAHSIWWTPFGLVPPCTVPDSSEEGQSLCVDLFSSIISKANIKY